MMLCIPDPERGPPRWQRHPGVSANALTTPPARPNTVNVRTSAVQGVRSYGKVLMRLPGWRVRV
jgi:hypothetical protein